MPCARQFGQASVIASAGPERAVHDEPEQIVLCGRRWHQPRIRDRVPLAGAFRRNDRLELSDRRVEVIVDYDQAPKLC